MVEEDGEEIDSVLIDFLDFIGDLRIVAFNSPFDISFLKEALKIHKIKLNNEVSCALKMARRAWPGLESYTLANLAKMGGLSTNGNHRALKDCELTLSVYTAAASKLGTYKLF